MKIEGWKYYNHAAIPTTPPHETPDLVPVENGDIWKIGGRTPLLARWTTEFDCKHETNWWYVIKDTPFDISALKAKRRYEINKGIKNFEVKEIDPCHHREALFAVQVAAFSAYPRKYRPTVDKRAFVSEIDKWERFVVFGAFHRETSELAGYALLSKETCDYVDFKVLKTKPEQEKNAVNAALVAGVLQYFNRFLSEGGFICDGARSINHETLFQDYIEKYFGFRKVYCKLHIVYNPKVKAVIQTLFPLRNVLRLFDFIGVIHQINAIMKMDELVREKK